jgi:hypothetical protein
MATQVVEITVQNIQALLPERSQAEWDQLRESYLERGYVECSINGCQRLVNPAFIREIPGIGHVAICPDRAGRHAGRLGPARLAALMAAYRAAASQPTELPDNVTPIGAKQK